MGKSAAAIMTERARVSAWQKRNPERMRAYQRAYYQNNRERLLAQKRVDNKRTYDKYKNDPEWISKKKEAGKRYREKRKTDPVRLDHYRARGRVQQRISRDRLRTKAPEKYAQLLAQSLSRVMRAQRAKRQFAHNAMKDGCVDCGEKDVRVLELDHVRGQKIMGVSAMVSRNMSIERITAEIAKCEVRCANCHRRKTWERRERVG